ncbi:uncharacterized protein P174DRAFT_423485 [Aspergillus novofumigatus IBT 16806]|uniref:Uncharacterized protein n=1 Tax=Aspergillus novofumigatus (strain IBT 16806) TaxID=1392255 RepID=A0A2I1BZ20_ASPN1|nr:uncharacterized protein P174DRAFT_423485 [Aspergillus novofumigatus IBT 16806]PKX90615.1 hypothetical protein P174DRAFT_423485 [Aspergillus novofumigatus IBT 16806]
MADGSAAWYVTGHAAKTIRTRVHQAVALGAPMSGLRLADLADEATDDADVDWLHHEYKQLATMAELPSRPIPAPPDADWALPVISACYVCVETWETQFLTTTPMYNRAFDMYGYLAILFSGFR